MVTKAQNLPMANFSQINQKTYKPNVLHLALGERAFVQILTLNDHPPFTDSKPARLHWKSN